MKRVISTNAADVAQALNQLEGYPKPPDYRGPRCPPAPFGRTEGYRVVDLESHAGVVPVDEAVLNRHAGESVQVGGQLIIILEGMGVPLPDAVPVDVEPGRGARR